jgi:hypothetical protein
MSGATCYHSQSQQSLKFEPYQRKGFSRLAGGRVAYATLSSQTKSLKY